MPRSDYWPFKRNEQEDKMGIGKTLLLQKQLGDMEGEVKEMQIELAAIRRNHQDEHFNPLGKVMEAEEVEQESQSRESNLNCVKDKFDNEGSEIPKLRDDLIRAKHAAEEERFHRMKCEARLLDMEQKLKEICETGKVAGVKEKKMKEDEVVGLKTQVRILKETIEEMKITDEDKTKQLQEYRVKYLQAQQNVEELQRQMDIMDSENKHSSDQIQMEFHNMMKQFQEKLLELAPLPDLLRSAQIQLQEAKQLQKLAEDNAQQISNELHRDKEKLVSAVIRLNEENIEKRKLLEENSVFKVELEEKQKKIDELTKYIADYECKVLRLEEKHLQLETRYDEKAAEYIVLAKSLDELKEESTRTLNRVNERSKSMKNYLQTQIAELEKQLASCRAQCRSYQRDRDEIRQRTQIQISNLKENFDMVEVRLHGLQRQVVLLKQCYSLALNDEVEERGDVDYANYAHSQ